MRVKTGTLVAVCLVLSVLIGSASACINGASTYTCRYGAVLLGYGVRNGRCVEIRQYLRQPSACNGCRITARADSGSMSVYVPNSGTYTCRYRNDFQTKTCVAYCLNSDGSIERGSYECFTASAFQNTCSCTNVCNNFNPWRLSFRLSKTKLLKLQQFLSLVVFDWRMDNTSQCLAVSAFFFFWKWFVKLAMSIYCFISCSAKVVKFQPSLEQTLNFVLMLFLEKVLLLNYE